MKKNLSDPGQGQPMELQPVMETPGELEAAMKRALGDNPSPTAFEILDAAERLLKEVLRSGCDTRASALDLLTVDALVTRALEIAARNAELLAEFPELAMKRIASIEE